MITLTHNLITQIQDADTCILLHKYHGFCPSSNYKISQTDSGIAICLIAILSHSRLQIAGLAICLRQIPICLRLTAVLASNPLAGRLANWSTHFSLLVAFTQRALQG